MSSTIASQAWGQIVSQVNGLAVGSTLEVLHRRGQLEPLALGRTLVEGNPAYLKAARRALVGLGWCDHKSVTEHGREALQHAKLYENVSGWLAHLQNGAERPISRAPQLGESRGAWQVQKHLEGFEIASQLDDLSADSPCCVSLGWSKTGDWTALGQHALALLNVFNYPLSYLRLLSQADQLLFGDPSLVPVDGEAHIDRKRDIRFSGQVFSPPLAEAFMSLLLPLFEAPNPPRCLFDLGCGDGRMLRELSSLLTVRLQRQPTLILVGGDTSSIARDVARETLKDSSYEAHVVEADIGEPAQIARRLDDLGHSPEETVFVCKSVIHNRTFRGGVELGQESSGAWVGLNAEQLTSFQVEGDLSEFFQRWKPFLQRHGMVCAEAHTVSEEVVMKNSMRSLQPCLDLTHTYSRQLLVEAPVFWRCAERAGLDRQGGYEFGAAAQGHNAMTVDRFFSP